jgi:hypothetical protein
MIRKNIHEVPAAHLIAAVLQSDALLEKMQHELIRVLPGITINELKTLLREEILRTEVIEGEDATEADAMLTRIAQLRAKGLTMTQTIKVLTGQQHSKDADEEDEYHVLMHDMRHSGEGG